MQTIKQIGEYKVKEIFNENGKEIREILQDVFGIYFMEEYKKLVKLEDTEELG